MAESQGDEAKLQSEPLVDAFKRLKPIRLNWIGITKALCTQSDEFLDQDVQRSVIEYLQTLPLVQKDQWLQVIRDTKFSAVVGAGRSSLKESGVGLRDSQDQVEGNRAYKKLEVKLPYQEGQNVLNFYSVFKQKMRDLKVPESDQLILWESYLNKKTADMFSSVKSSMEGASLEMLVKKTALLMGAGSRIISIRELNLLTQGPREEAWSFYSRFEQVLLRYKIFNKFDDEEIPYWFLSKLHKADKIEVMLGPDVTVDRIIQFANTLQPAQERGTGSTPPKKDQGQSTPAKKCSHCKRSGHDDKSCWKLHPELKPAGKRNQAQDHPKKDKAVSCEEAIVQGKETFVKLDSCAHISCVKQSFVDAYPELYPEWRRKLSFSGE